MKYFNNLRTACVILAALCAQAAGAQGIVTLICSDAPNGPASDYVVINYDRSVVSMSTSPTAHSAQVSLGQIVWQTPRVESATGEMRFAARHTLDRTTGMLRSQLQCLPKESSFCGPETTLYCRTGLRP